MEALTETTKTRFGDFEADLRAGELRKNGIRLEAACVNPSRFLSLLLEHPGEVIAARRASRETLARRTHLLISIPV